MDDLVMRYQAVLKCLQRLEGSLVRVREYHDTELYNSMRDSVIKSFEFTIDTFWKFLRECLEKKHLVIFSKISPREVFKSALEVGAIDAQELIVLEQMVNDRNLTAHAYKEEYAEEIAHNAVSYAKLLNVLMKRLAP